MTLRYLFGPVPAAFAEQNLQPQRRAGACLAFNADGDADLTVRPDDPWDKVRQSLPHGWEPDALVLWLPYTTVPAGLWSAPLPRVGLAPDWHLLWTYYRRRLPSCDLVFTDTLGSEFLNRHGLAQARPANLCGAERGFLEGTWPEQPRDIDVLFVGNLNPAVQRERMPWLARLARLGRRWRVVLRSGVAGESYRRLLARARIVLHHSARHKCGRRAWEAAAAGALVFQEADNRELPALLRDRQECVYYRADDLEPLLEHYLEHEDERRALAEAARARARDGSFAEFWERLTQEMAEELGRAARRPAAPGGADELLTRCWQALGGSRFEDTALVADLEKAAEARPESADLHNALGVALGRQAQGRSSAPFAAAVAAEHFRRALACQPDHLLAGLNLAEALDAAGQDLAAIDAARRTLELLQRQADLDPACLDAPIFGRSFDTFRIEWERAAWANAGQPGAEVEARCTLLRWHLCTLLGRWTGDLVCWYEAALLRPDLSPARAGLGAALLRAGRGGEALAHLRLAAAGNPFDREAARLSFQALGALGDAAGQRRLVEERRLLSRAAPQVVPEEAWFAGPRPAADALASIIILCCDELDCTRLCLESVLRHSRSPYELIVVDNGSTDGTPEYLAALARRPGPARVEVIRNESNRGFPAGCNQALARAGGEYVVFLNNDTVLTPGWLDGLVGWARHDWPRVGLVGPVTNCAPDAQGVRPGYSSLDDLGAFAVGRRQAFAGKTLAVRRLTGFCLLARREVLERVGGFDERFGAGFFDDDDLCVRAREAGFRLLVALDTYVHHFGSRTFEGLGIDTRRQLQENFERFRDKWGAEHAAGYHLPPPPPAVPAEAEPAPAAATAEEEGPPPFADVSSSLPAGEEALGEQAPAPAAAGPAVSTNGRPRVSLCMIVKNEEHHLPDCLRSVAGLFDEVIVVDTGSADATRDVARGFGARVFDLPWPDSFGAARNESLRHASGQWILWLDADDRLDEDNRKRLREVLAGLGEERDAYAMKVRSVLDANRTTFRLLDQVRLFRNLPEVRWDYRVHEQILPAVNRAGGAVRWAEVIIDHVGYQDPKFRRGKLERNLRLLELDHADRPDDAFTLFNLGWTLLDLGRAADAVPHLGHALKQTKPSSSTLRKLHHLLALAQRHLGHPDEALAACREALRQFPDDAELLCEEGLLRRDTGDLGGAEESWLRLLEARRGRYFASEEVGLRGFKTRQLLAEVYRVRQRWAEAEVQWRAALAERADFEPAWEGLAELYLRQKRWSDLEDLLDKREVQGAVPPKVGWLRARGQLQRQEFAAARRTLQGVIAADGQALGPRVLLTHVLLQEGRDWAGTERALREVLTLDPGHAETRHNLKVLLRRLGREPVAV
ncbi:MAG TPA: glycosyltransferase [Gemmataceae bacterium]|nr:glycosyltransferase [Gemmataceae bacterium]